MGVELAVASVPNRRWLPPLSQPAANWLRVTQNANAPAAASGPLIPEQSRQVGHVFRPHGPSVDVCAHEHEATQTWS